MGGQCAAKDIASGFEACVALAIGLHRVVLRLLRRMLFGYVHPDVVVSKRRIPRLHVCSRLALLSRFLLLTEYDAEAALQTEHDRRLRSFDGLQAVLCIVGDVFCETRTRVPNLTSITPCR
jgi:hypothetical protein